MPPRRHLSGEYSEDDESASGGAATSSARAPSVAAMPKPSPADMPKPSPADLEAMKYRDLQKFAKELGVKANLARAQLLQKILEALTNRPEEGEHDCAFEEGPFLYVNSANNNLVPPSQNLPPRNLCRRPRRLRESRRTRTRSIFLLRVS